jgi:Asp-tRNA(Asn)/Glu-tRNA(Gln) amidotransferase A subunit family amidase
MEAFWAYERALMADDVTELDRLFAPGPATLRGDGEGLLVGHDAIAAFRAVRGGAPARRIVATHVRTIDADHALVVAVTEPERGGCGQQTQLWVRGESGWQVVAAHVSGPAPALDRRVWRVVGDPLVVATAPGPLTGRRVAVKDLVAVAGHRIGAGNPAWLAAAEPEAAHAPVVAALLAAGADVAGIARTDELAWSLAGTNVHTGTPPNPRAPHRISGGSSSGPASAVSLGHADIGLATDTGGSIRVPAAYQGLAGHRPTHGAVSTGGVLPLAPSFDTVGWLTREPGLLAAVGDVLLPADTADLVPEPDLVHDAGLTALAAPEVAQAVESWAAARGVRRLDGPLGPVEEWRAAFSTLQGWEAVREHGGWAAAHAADLGPDVRARFERAARTTAAEAERARTVVASARARVREVLADRVLVLPAAPTTAPRLGADLGPVREATLALTCVAGVAGLPAVTLPLTAADGLPCGVSLVGPAGSDRALLALATRLAATARTGT